MSYFIDEEIWKRKAKKFAKDRGAISTVICQVPLNNGEIQGIAK